MIDRRAGPSRAAAAPRPAMAAPREPSAAGQAAPSAATPAPRRVASSQIFSGAHEIEIVHREQVYRLRQTALGKLILTK